MGRTINSNFSMIRLAWNGSPAWVICNMLNIIINPLRNLTMDVLLIGYIFNAIHAGHSFTKMIPLFIGIGIFYIINLLFEAVLIAYVDPVGDIKIKQYIDGLLCRNAASVPLSSYDNADYYNDYIFSMQNSADIAKQAVNNMASFIAYTLGGLMGIGLIANIEPVMTVFIVFSILTSFFISSRRNKLNFKYRERIAGLQVKEQYIHRVFYMKDYAKELRSLKKLPDFLLNMFAKVEDENTELTKEYGKKSLFYSVMGIVNNRLLMYWLVMLLTIGIIYYRGNIEPGNLLIMTVSIGTAALLIGAIVNIVPAMNNIMMYHQKLTKFLEEPIGGHNVAETHKRVIREIQSIRFHHVSFTYPNEKQAVLDDVSFEVQKNEKLAIVGVNGSGKTTILKLILKFYKPDSGNIYINGIDINEIDEVEYRKAFGCVFQDVNLYAMPARRNISLSEQTEDQEKLTEVIFESGLSKVFPTEKERDRHLTRELSDKGMILSGGNAQKVAIARALYQDVSVFLFDEITSALDPEMEKDILDRIDSAGKEKITVLISHKLSCTKDTDKIIFLEDGKIVETGSHHDLILRRGRYYSLFKLQSEQFEKHTQEETLREEAWL